MFHMCGMMLLLRSVLNMRVQRAYVFRCLISLLGPCELLAESGVCIHISGED